MGSIALPEETIFRSKLPDIEITNDIPLHTYCFERLAEFAGRPCVIDGATGTVLTYAEVDAAARGFAAGLFSVGIGRGDVFMILLRNSPEFVIAFLAASYRGAVATTANPFYTSGEIHKQAAGSGARLIITESCYVDKIREFARERDITIVTVGDGPAPDGCRLFADLMGTDASAPSAAEFDPDDVVALPYSSGTTGLPKGVMLTHRSLITSVAQQVDGDNPNLYLHQDDVLLCVLPLFHIYSLNSVLLCGLRVGAAILIMRRFEVGPLLELVQRHRVTIAPLVPPIVLEFVKSPLVNGYDLSSIRMVMSGAAPMGKELEDNFMAKLPNAQLGQVRRPQPHHCFGLVSLLDCRYRRGNDEAFYDALPLRVRDDGGGAGAFDVSGVRKGAVQREVGRVRHRGEERRDEDRGPRDRRVVRPQPARRDLHPRSPNHER
ncbi:hypothetical protein BHM03_00051081 [Ensete ventricosum]|nr:hypothetical protein BHM03_00051081 [Ensete ventricosum]